MFSFVYRKFKNNKKFTKWVKKETKKKNGNFFKKNE